MEDIELGVQCYLCVVGIITSGLNAIYTNKVKKETQKRIEEK